MSFTKELEKLLKQKTPKTKKQLNSLKLQASKITKIQHMPSDPDIWLSLSPSLKKKYRSLFAIKKSKSLSGIVAVAIMPAPYPCPNSCIYCPNSLVQKDTPKSYTGNEPATMRAIRANYSAKKQTSSRIKQLQTTGHSTEKLELIVMGGTFPALPTNYRRRFMLSSFSAIANKKIQNLKQAKKTLMHSKNRLTALTFETRPDYCSKKDMDWMLSYGATRLELGVQIPSEKIYSFINRQHSVQDVITATQHLKDSAFKVTYHMMLGLQQPAQDIKSFKNLFSNPDFKPDALKIYPTLILPNTKLYKLYKQKKYTPLTTKKAVKTLAKIKSQIPRYVRIMRIQRDIPSTVVSAGPNCTNIRQLAQLELKNQNLKCNCIRCREASRTNESIEKPKLFIEKYTASKGTEFFISYESKSRNSLLGLVRLRLPHNPHRKELQNSALIRELRVFGQSLPLHKKGDSYQHKGIGKLLMQKAEEIAQNNDYKKLSVISGWGVIPYYKKLGYKIDSAYVSKKLF